MGIFGFLHKNIWLLKFKNLYLGKNKKLNKWQNFQNSGAN